MAHRSVFVSLRFRPVDSVSVVPVEVVYPLLQFVAAGAALYTQGKQGDVGVQRELIHGIYTAQILQHEEQDRRPLGTWAVGLNKHTNTHMGVSIALSASSIINILISALFLSLSLIQRRNL